MQVMISNKKAYKIENQPIKLTHVIMLFPTPKLNGSDKIFNTIKCFKVTQLSNNSNSSLNC